MPVAHFLGDSRRKSVQERASVFSAIRAKPCDLRHPILLRLSRYWPTDDYDTNQHAKFLNPDAPSMADNSLMMTMKRANEGISLGKRDRDRVHFTISSMEFATPCIPSRRMRSASSKGAVMAWRLHSLNTRNEQLAAQQRKCRHHPALSDLICLGADREQ